MTPNLLQGVRWSLFFVFFGPLLMDICLSVCLSVCRAAAQHTPSQTCSALCCSALSLPARRTQATPAAPPSRTGHGAFLCNSQQDNNKRHPTQRVYFITLLPYGTDPSCPRPRPQRPPVHSHHGTIHVTTCRHTFSATPNSRVTLNFDISLNVTANSLSHASTLLCSLQLNSPQLYPALPSNVRHSNYDPFLLRLG